MAHTAADVLIETLLDWGVNERDHGGVAKATE
jgi:hypothetical protein